MEDPRMLKRYALELEYEVAAFVFKTDSTYDDLHLLQLVSLATAYRQRAAQLSAPRDTDIDDLNRLVERAAQRTGT